MAQNIHFAVHALRAMCGVSGGAGSTCYPHPEHGPQNIQPTLCPMLLQGGSLAGLMVKQLLAGSVPKYTFSQALGWCLDVARALQYLHAGGRDGAPRVHRDVKVAAGRQPTCAVERHPFGYSMSGCRSLRAAMLARCSCVVLQGTPRHLANLARSHGNPQAGTGQTALCLNLGG